ncbi:MAG: hypothetical protein J3Q66DRAFT_49613 [Benniella sp.]|nr:MAG: hypothetical protein J3Q66DRAFT_49613 [Benniella sp.]
MVKRPNKRDSNELEQEYEERRQYIRENAPLMDLETLAKGFFTKFNANSKSAAHDALHASLHATGFEQLAKETKLEGFKTWMTNVFQEDKKNKKLSLEKVIKRHRTRLQTSGVIKGAQFIQSGMDLLAPEGSSSAQAVSKEEESEEYESDRTVSHSAQKTPRTPHPSRKAGKRKREAEPVAAQALTPNEDAQNGDLDPTQYPVHFANLGQTIVWNVDGTDMVQEFRQFRLGHLSPFSLARDGIADLTLNSTFSKALDPAVLSIARRVDPAPDIYKRWPTLEAICNRVFASDHYDQVATAVRSESMQDPIAAYLFLIIMAYWQYFQFHDEVPENINEREGFVGLTWTFMQTPLTMYEIESRYMDILITAVEERRNQDKDLLYEMKETGQFADAVAIRGNQQLLLAEAALIHNPKLEKRLQDEFKLARAMRDSWISHVRSISNLSVPPRGLAVFGSVSFKDETKVMIMDFQGMFRLKQFDLFTIPLRKRDFGIKMRAAVISCLELAARLHEEIERRHRPRPALGFYERTVLADAIHLIEKTTSTPTKTSKRK